MWRFGIESAENDPSARPDMGAVARRLRGLRGHDCALDAVLAEPWAAGQWAASFVDNEGAWYSWVDPAPIRAQFSFIGAVARVPGAIEALARAGDRVALHHGMRHPWGYAQRWTFRQQTLEAARLGRLLADAERGCPSAVRAHIWQAEGLRVEQHGSGPTMLFDLHEARWLPHTPSSQACVDDARVSAYLGAGRTLAELRQLGFAYPPLVLASLLRCGRAEAAEELLDAGCLLPRWVVERWTVSEAAADVDGDSDIEHAPSAWTTCWSPLGACLRGGGWRPSSAQRRVAHALLARGARPSLCDRMKLALVYGRRPPAPGSGPTPHSEATGLLEAPA